MPDLTIDDVPDELVRELSRIAARQGMTVEIVIRSALIEYAREIERAASSDDDGAPE